MIGAIRLPRLLRKPLLDVRLGFALMRDGRVPLRTKLLPILGAAGDFVIDGAEMIAGPLLLANVLLPFLAPRAVVEQIRSERSTGAPKSPIIDV